MSRQPSKTWLTSPNTSGKRARLKRKLIVFKAVVLYTLLYGLEVAGLSEADIVCLEKEQVQMLRTVLGEGGCRTVHKDGKKIFLRRSSEEVLQLAGFGSVRSTLRARRLCWLRRACATERADGIAFPPLAAVCGRFRWEKETRAQLGRSSFSRKIWSSYLIMRSGSVMVNGRNKSSTSALMR